MEKAQPSESMYAPCARRGPSSGPTKTYATAHTSTPRLSSGTSPGIVVDPPPDAPGVVAAGGRAAPARDASEPPLSRATSCACAAFMFAFSGSTLRPSSYAPRAATQLRKPSYAVPRRE